MKLCSVIGQFFGTTEVSGGSLYVLECDGNARMECFFFLKKIEKTKSSSTLETQTVCKTLYNITTIKRYQLFGLKQGKNSWLASTIGIMDSKSH